MLRDDEVLVLVHEHLAGVGHQPRVVVHRKGCGGALGRCKAPVLRQPGPQRVGQILRTSCEDHGLKPLWCAAKREGQLWGFGPGIQGRLAVVEGCWIRLVSRWGAAERGCSASLVRSVRARSCSRGWG